MQWKAVKEGPSQKHVEDQPTQVPFLIQNISWGPRAWPVSNYSRVAHLGLKSISSDSQLKVSEMPAPTLKR